jgi:hypothetical protein
MAGPNNIARSDYADPQFVIIFVHSPDIKVASSIASLCELTWTVKGDGAFNHHRSPMADLPFAFVIHLTR